MPQLKFKNCKSVTLFLVSPDYTEFIPMKFIHLDRGTKKFLAPEVRRHDGAGADYSSQSMASDVWAGALTTTILTPGHREHWFELSDTQIAQKMQVRPSR